ncbi:MAG: hypothetical protein ACRDA0_00920 [Cetobacterium sp.]|uniref:hypothetical protein n=1 Tax=Cetobacterium sp. TaxID=2071632 RepID=UPI003F4112B3
MANFGNYEFKDIEEAKNKLDIFLEANPDLEKECKKIIEKNKQPTADGHEIIKLHYTTLESLIVLFFKDNKLNITVDERELYRDICKAYIKYDSLMK